MFKYRNNTFALNILLLLIVCAGVTCIDASCTSDIPDKPEPVKGAEVLFDVSNFSRASVTTSFNQFAVYGDMKSDDNAATVIFNKTEVVRNGTDWTYEGLQYWYPNHEHSFVAIYPLSVVEDADNPLYSDSKLSFAYSLPATQEGTVSDEDVADIVAATHRRFYQENEVAGVTRLTFGHLLSLVNFTLELTDPTMKSTDCYIIHKIEISGFGTSATIDIKPSSLQGAAQTFDSDINIVTAKGNGRMDITFATPIVVTNGAGGIKMFSGNDAIIMLPQKFSTDDKVKIDLTCSVNDAEVTNTMSATLSDFKWESGKSYNYTLRLASDNKLLLIKNAEIKDWDLVANSGEIDAR